MPQFSELRVSLFRRRKPRNLNERRGTLHRFSLLASDIDLVASAVLDECFVDHHIVRRHSMASLRDADVKTKRLMRRGESAAALMFGTTHDEKDFVEIEIIDQQTGLNIDQHELDKDKISLAREQQRNVTLESATSDISQSSSTDDDRPETWLNAHLSLVFAGVLFGSVAANAAFERLNTIDPGCGSVIALMQYVAAASERLPSASVYIKRPMIPMRFHATFCILQFLAMWLGNACLAFDLPFAQFLVIKNSNLVFSMALGFIALHQRYTLKQVMSVLLLSAGIILTVLSDKNPSSDDGTSQQNFVGVALCLAATLCNVVLGFTQEYAFRTYKDNDGSSVAAEVMFYTHILGLPFFLSSGANAHFAVLAANWQSSIPLVIVNVGAMVLCKFCIFSLVDLAGSLTTTMTVTVARFLGVVVSVCFLSTRALPGKLFWLGSSAVVVGSTSYLLGNICSEK